MYAEHQVFLPMHPLLLRHLTIAPVISALSLAVEVTQDETALIEFFTLIVGVGSR
jgi:hypothetical protein